MKRNTPPSGSKRPTATIDLKATELKSNDPKTEDKSDTDAAGTEKPAEASRATTASDKPAVDKKTAENDKPTPPKGPSDTSGDNDKNGAENNDGTSGTGGGGFGSHLIASLTGAVIGILGLSFASNQNLLPASFDFGGGASKQQLASLKAELETLKAQTSSNDATSLQSRIQNLSAELDKTLANLGGENGASALTAKVTALENTIDSLEQAAKTGNGGQLAGLTAVTKELKRANEQATELNSEFIKMRDEQSAFRDDLASLRSAQADFHATTAKLADQLAKLRSSTAKIVADASRPPDVSAQINPVASELAGLKAQVEGLVQRENTARKEGRDIALALSLGELKRAVNQGVPYRAELERVLPHAPQSLDLTVLEAYADQGITTREALRKQFDEVANKALAAEATATSGSLVDQLLANAKSMVRVRPTGLVEGDTTGAILSRMEYKFNHGDLAGCVKEGDALRGQAREVMKGWLEKARARNQSDQLLLALEDKIRTALAGSTQ